MLDYSLVSADITLRGLIRRVWLEKGGTQKEFLMNFFEILLQAGCDYYELMDLYSEHTFSDKEVELLAHSSPSPKIEKHITPQNVRDCIYRWTPSKYHTASISFVVNEITKLLLLDIPGITIYNNNHNPHSKRAVNDKYILLITETESLFLDISRKTTIKFKKKKGGEAYAENRDM